MATINASIGFDQKLWAQDIEGSLAHVTMLADTGIITPKEARTIEDGLKRIRHEIESEILRLRNRSKIFT